MRHDNTVGSLTPKQHAILVGSLLGDGTLRKQGTRKNSLFEVNHALSQREYVDWKWKHFHEYVLTPPKARRGNGRRVAYRFTTRSIPTFTRYYEWFYNVGKKQVPKNIVLDPLVLAVWFMDDGTKIRNAFYLNTQQFSIVEQQLLKVLLQKLFGIVCDLNRDKQYYRLRINMESTRRMRSIIEPFVLPSLRYKLGVVTL